MRRLIPLAILLAILLPGAPAGAQPDGAQPAAAEAAVESPALAEAREAYNAGRYNDAARRFLKLVQANPADAGLYRSLARARVWADEAEGAIIAYRFYLVLAPAGAEDREKIDAELKLAERKAGQPVPPGPPARAARTLAAAEVRAKAGTFAGPDGAFGAIRAAVDDGYIGPDLATVRAQVRGLLQARSEDALTAWWRPEQVVRQKTLASLAEAWQEAAEITPHTPAEALVVRALDGLAKLQGGDFEGALGVLSEVAPGDPRLRYAQALALVQAERDPEAADVLATLSEQVEDRRVGILAAMVAARQGAAEAPTALRRALLEE